jgi:hypothetical protein
MKIYIFFLIFIIASCAKQNDPENIPTENEFCSKYSNWPRTSKFDLVGQNIIQTMDKNFIFAGLNSEFTGNIFKFDAEGNKIWSYNQSKKYLFTQSVFETPTGDLEIIFKLGSDSLFYAKLSKEGKLLQDIINIPLQIGEIKKVEIVEENTIILFFIDENGKTNVQKLKIQPLTVEKSNKFWLYFINGLSFKQNGDIIIYGSQNLAELICLDKDLNIKWEKTLEHEKSGYIIYPSHIFIENDDEFISSNYSFYYSVDSIGSYNSRMTKYNALGDVLWTKDYGCNKFDLVPLDVQKYDNRYFVTGIAMDRKLLFWDTFLQCLNKNGDEIYMKIYEGERRFDNSQYSNNIFKTKDGMFLLVYRKGNHTSIAKVNELGEN